MEINELDNLKIYREYSLYILDGLRAENPAEAAYWLGKLYASLEQRMEYLEIDKCKLPKEINDRVIKNYCGE